MIYDPAIPLPVSATITHAFQRCQNGARQGTLGAICGAWRFIVTDIINNGNRLCGIIGSTIISAFQRRQNGVTFGTSICRCWLSAYESIVGSSTAPTLTALTPLELATVITFLMVTNITPTPKREPSIALVEIPSKVHYNGRIAQELAVLSPAQRQEISDRLTTSLCEVLACLLVGNGQKIVPEEVASEGEATVIDATLEEIDSELEFALTVPLPEDDDNDDTDNHCEKTELVHPVVEPPKSKALADQSPEVDFDASISINETVASVVVDVELELILTTPLPEDDNSADDCEMVPETALVEAHKFDEPARCQSPNPASTVPPRDNTDKTVEPLPATVEPRARETEPTVTTTKSSTTVRKAKFKKIAFVQPSIALHGLGRWSDPKNRETTSAPSISGASRWELANSPYLWTNVVRQREQAAAEAMKQEEKMRKLEAGIQCAEKAAERIKRMIEEMRRGRSEVEKAAEVVIVNNASSKVEDGAENDGVLGLALLTPLSFEEEEDDVNPVQANVEELALADIADDEELALAINTPLPTDELERAPTVSTTSEDAFEQDEQTLAPTTLDDEQLTLALKVPLPTDDDELELEPNAERVPTIPASPEDDGDNDDLSLTIRTTLPIYDNELEPTNLESAPTTPATPEEDGDDVLSLAIRTPLPIDEDELEPVKPESAPTVAAIREEDLFKLPSVPTQLPAEDESLSLALSLPLPPDDEELELELLSVTLLNATTDDDDEFKLALSIPFPPDDVLEPAPSAPATLDLDLALGIPLPADVDMRIYNEIEHEGTEGPLKPSDFSWDDEDAEELPPLDVMFASPSTAVVAATNPTPQSVLHPETSRAIDGTPARSAETVDDWRAVSRQKEAKVQLERKAKDARENQRRLERDAKEAEESADREKRANRKAKAEQKKEKRLREKRGKYDEAMARITKEMERAKEDAKLA
ncbi:hypothetical protein DXG03_004099 [Asterophora parasitica]|uniref:Uncharacterized protein n=1 Tax=Asterophora parasitica TaxID=117018 RepID=A0A9P7G0Y2_9AGAR|nr:hypothetical protein DXG03_004099 [Asterophora parasitica]